MDVEGLLEKIKNRKIRKDQLMILLLVGVLFLVITIPTGNEKKENNNTEDQNKSGSGESGLTEQEYVSYMERQLEEILSQMEGAGEVKVMITLKESSEKVIEKDLETSSEKVSEKDSQGGERTTTSETFAETTIYGENDENATLGSTEGTTGQGPYVSKELTPRVEGVVVVATGGDNAVVIKNITEAVQALFSVDTHKIRIVKKE
ncbi:MAG: stage III sporulation protein AG [Lachnospiraceae bacterium]